MEKVYPLLNWLEMGQALDWLQGLTESHVTPHELLSLCDAKHCTVYVDICKPVKGTDEETWLLEVTGCGIQQVRNPMALADSGELKDGRLELLGRVTWKDEKGTYITEPIEWDASVVMFDIFPIFKPADIRALAYKMNGAVNQPTAADIEDLRDQLKKACDAKENAWHLTDKYKAELEVLRVTAEQDRSSRESAWLRAEQAEKLVEEIAVQRDRMEAKADYYQDSLEESRVAVAKLSNTVEHEQKARTHAESLAKELRDELENEHQARIAENKERTGKSLCACEQSDAVLQSTTGITFPYATKQLKAMRDAALAHWADHDRSKPAPYGIQKTVASFLSSRIGDNARKLPELAGAIKPDDLPKA